jgi:hypothetical protein
MSDTGRLNREKLVEIHRARSEWEGRLLVDYLAGNGVEADLRLPAGDPLLEALEMASGADKACGVFVLEHDADRGSALAQEFLALPTDESALERAATQNLQPGAEPSPQDDSGSREEKA